MSEDLRPSAVLARRFPGDWQPAGFGESRARVWRVSGSSELFVKVVDDDGSEHAAGNARELRAEAERSEWLASQGFPAPRVIELGRVDGADHLVTTAIPGRTLADPWPVDARPQLIANLADLSRRLHAIPPDSCPYRRDLAVLVPAAAAAVAAGTVDEDDFDSDRAGRSAGDVLHEILRTRPSAEDLVVCHGDLCLPNVLADPDTGRITGVVDLGRLGLADRHQDLALATRSLGPVNDQYGPAAAVAFLDRYGIAADPELIEFYRLLDELF